MALPPSVIDLADVLHRLLRLTSRTRRRTLLGARLSPSQADVLDVLSSGDETRLTALSRTLDVSKSNVSSSLESLEQMGLLTRTRRSDDRRVYTVRLTESGRAYARRIRQEQERDVIRAAAGLTPYQRKTLASALAELLDALESRPGDGA